MAKQVITLDNLSNTFDIGVIETSKIHVKIDGTLTRATDGTIGLDPSSLKVVSSDTGQIITEDANGKAFLDQAAIQAVETVWSGIESDGFLTSAAGGINGHTVTYSFDWTNAAFKEAVQDAIGEAALAGAGITYDDVANTISTNLGNIVFGDGLNYDTTANVVTVKPDTTSPSTVEVSSAGVKITANVSTDAGNLAVLGSDNKIAVTEQSVKDLATVDVQDAFGVHQFYAFE